MGLLTVGAVVGAAALYAGWLGLLALLELVGLR